MTAERLSGGGRGDAPVPPALEARGLTKSFGGVLALDDVDLVVESGEVHALLGENGSGKSTLIKLLSGYHEAERSASVKIGGSEMTLGDPASSYDLGCRFVHQDLGLIDSETIANNLCLGTTFPLRFGTIRPRALRSAALADLANVGLDVDPGTVVGELSPAIKTGVAIAKALSRRGASTIRLLVLDEPTATMPEHEVNELLALVARVAASGVGVIYVTHRLDEVFRAASNVTVLRDGRLQGTQPTGTLDHDSLVRLLVGSEIAQIQAASEALASARGEPLLTVESLAAGAVKDVSFQLAPGEIVGVAGITGSGRETVLGSIFGAQPREGGRVLVGGAPIGSGRPDKAMRAGIAYLPPDRVRLGGLMALSARENMSVADLSSLWSKLGLRRGRERAEVSSWFEKLAIRPASGIESQLAKFSGGNQQKVLFAKWLRREPRVFMLDEPTQGVDVGAKLTLHRRLLAAADAGTAVIVSSCDADELAALCQRVLVLSEGRIAADLRGHDVSVDKIIRESIAKTRKVTVA